MDLCNRLTESYILICSAIVEFCQAHMPVIDML